MKLYSKDEYGNIIEGQSDSAYNGKPVYNPRIWSTEKPVENIPGKVHIMDGVNPGWQIVDDTRGTWYRTDTGEEIIIDKIGVSNEGLTKLKPADDFQKWELSKWIPDTEKKAAYEKREKEIQEKILINQELEKIARERLGLVKA